MMQFAEQFPDFGIVSPLTTQLSWSHIVEVPARKTPEARLFCLGGGPPLLLHGHQSQRGKQGQDCAVGQATEITRY